MPMRRFNPIVRGPLGGPALAGASSSLEAQCRQIERKRKRCNEIQPRPLLPRELLSRLTLSSFHLEKLSVSRADVELGLSVAADQRAFRPPQVLRIRNHVAILRWIERAQRGRRLLQPASVVRWYTSISCGLSIGALDDSRAARLEQAIGRMNSPQHRLSQALGEVAGLHVQLVGDPLFPGFNGLLSRLLLQYHLSRCDLPPVIFDPAVDGARVGSEQGLMGRLAELILESYEMLMG